MSTTPLGPIWDRCPRLAVLLRAVARGVRRLSAEDLLDVQRWLDAEPEIGPDGLRAGLASMLARDAVEWGRIARLVEQFCQGRLDEAGVTAVPEPVDRDPARPGFVRVYRPEPPMSRATALLWRLGQTGRAVLLGGLITSLWLLVVGWPTIEQAVLAEPSAPATGAAASGSTVVETVSTTWRFVELEAAREIIAWLPVGMDAGRQAFLAACTVLLGMLGLWWRQLADHAAEDTAAERAEADRQANEQRKALEAAWVAAGARPLHLFAVDPPPPLRARTLEDALASLARLRVGEETQELDVGNTADRTARRAGQVEAVYHSRHLVLAPVVLLDVGPGDHPWRQRLERTVLAWRRQGLLLDLYVFRNHDPGTVYRYEDREPVELAELGRRTEGRPLIVLSHGLLARGMRGTKTWVEALPAWKRRVWLDPEPRAPDGRRQDEIDDIEALGLPWFPFHDEGVLAAVRRLHDPSVQAPARVAPPVAGGEREQAFRVWALAAAHVPDPTWDQLESFRVVIPRLSAWFPDPAHVAWLIVWVEAQEESGGRGLRDGGDGLWLSPKLEDRLLRWWRAQAARQPWLREIAAQLDELLMSQLSRAEPDEGTLEHAWWTLKVAWVRARLHPDQALGVLGGLVDGPLRQSALHLLRSEIARQREVGPREVDWKVEELEVLDAAVTEQPRVRWTRLVARPTVAVVVRGLAVGVVLGLTGVLVDGSLVGEVKLPRVEEVKRWERREEVVRGLKMVEIPAGEFVMGSPVAEEGRDRDEAQHRVRITRPFLLSTTEVTQGLYRDVMGVLPDCDAGTRIEGDDLPMHCVSWEDAVAFCAMLSELEGLGAVDGYRLPTEAEWEYAARAGTGMMFAGTSDEEQLCGFGNVLNGGEVKIDLYYPFWRSFMVAEGVTRPMEWNSNPEWRPSRCSDGHDGIAPVRTLRSNGWAVHDMSGNVWEWVADWYGTYSGDESDPFGARSGGSRVYRGGSWRDGPYDARVANRFSGVASGRSDDLGFRLAKSLPSALSPSDPLEAPTPE